MYMKTEGSMKRRLHALVAAMAVLAPAASCTAAPAGPALNLAAETAVSQPTVVGREPAPPAVLLETGFVEPSGRRIRVEPDERAATPGGLQTALDQAQPGDVI